MLFCDKVFCKIFVYINVDGSYFKNEYVVLGRGEKNRLIIVWIRLLLIVFE